MPHPIRVAVVGTGFGARIQVPGFQQSGAFEVVALVGRDAERTRAVADRGGVRRIATTIDEVLAWPDVDAVSIATPPDTHAPYAIAAARAGKHVLCEKPMALSVGEAEAMCAAAQSAGIVALVDHEFRVHPGRAMLGRLIARGDLGTPALLVAVDTIPLYVAPYRTAPAWWFSAEAGGGWLGASGSHLIDGCRLWLGEVTRATGEAVTLVNAPAPDGSPRTADDTFTLMLRFASGARAMLHQSAAVLGPRFQSVRVAGSKGTAWLDQDWMLWRVGRHGEPEIVAVDDDLALPVVDIPAWSGPFAGKELPSFVQMARRFARLIRGQPDGDPPLATFGDGLAVQRIMQAARV